MNYYELTFTYTSPVETSIINDVLAAELGEIGFESFAENENGSLDRGGVCKCKFVIIHIVLSL